MTTISTRFCSFENCVRVPKTCSPFASFQDHGRPLLCTYYDPRTSSWFSFFAPLLCYTWKRREWRTSRTYYDPRTSSWCSFFVMLISSHNLGGSVSALGTNNEWCDKCDARLFFMAIQQLDCGRNNYLHTNECFWSFTNLQNRRTGGFLLIFSGIRFLSMNSTYIPFGLRLLPWDCASFGNKPANW